MFARATRGIEIWREPGGIVEQSGDDIWRAHCGSVRAALRETGRGPEEVGAIGLDATCSLVVFGRQGAPLPVGPSGKAERIVIVWMDHRASPPAARINATGHDLHRYAGGRISPEMQTPKLLWLAENMPATFRDAALFPDLPDFLTWRATGDRARSLCTTTCKWTYLGHEKRWVLMSDSLAPLVGLIMRRFAVKQASRFNHFESFARTRFREISRYDQW